jgi:hypothetical protein
MPRFVLLRHEVPPGFDTPSHWDLMFEDGAALLTWRLGTLPAADGEPISAERLGDHRLAYLDYEGPVSGNRGDVRRVDAGEFRWIERSDSRLRVVLHGTSLIGELVGILGNDGKWRLTLAP